MDGIFSISAHLAILYCCLFNGFLVCLFWFKQNTPIFENIEAKLVFAFIISILINFSCLSALDFFNLDFNYIVKILPIISLLLLSAHAAFFKQTYIAIKHTTALKGSDYFRVFFYSVLFIIVLYNGGLIEQISDAWWHMSLTNKLEINNSLDSKIPHLNGVTSRYYPALWHANLISITKLSGNSIPIIWNAFTPWGSAIKVMAFYLLAFSLTRNKNIAFLSAALFVCVPGIGNSFMRVSAWPSHVSYTAMFASIFLAFQLIDNTRNYNRFSLLSKSFFTKQKLHFLLLALTLITILYSHKSELVWLASSLFFFNIGLALFSKNKLIESQLWQKTLLTTGLIGVIFLVGASTYIYLIKTQTIHLQLINLIYSFILFFILACIILLTLMGHRQLKLFMIILLVTCLLVGTNYQHFISLFIPELAHPTHNRSQYAVSINSIFNSQLSLPNWKLQLRAGLLFSGILGVIASLALVKYKKNRASIFLASNAVASFFILVSPFAYQWTLDMLQYHSPWRIGILIFHPIIFALCITHLISFTLKKQLFIKSISVYCTLILLFAIAASDTWKAHLDSNIIVLKRSHSSAQRNWNLFYSPKYVINDSSVRYEESFRKIKPLIKPNSYLYSDLASSYYAATYLPVYVKNIHSHQGANAFKKFRDLKNDRECHSRTPRWNQKLLNYLKNPYSRYSQRNSNVENYILINSDPINSQIRPSCLIHRVASLASSTPSLVEHIYTDETLTLYRLKQ